MDNVSQDPENVKAPVWPTSPEQMGNAQLTWELMAAVMEERTLLLKKELNALEPGRYERAERRTEAIRQVILARMGGES